MWKLQQGALRVDIEIKAKMKNKVMDKVSATAIWVDLVKKYTMNSSVYLENTPPSSLRIDNGNMIHTIEALFKNVSGTRYGLAEATSFFIPTSGYNDPPCMSTSMYHGQNAGYAAKILFAFEIFPVDLAEDKDFDGISELDNLGIKFDISRQGNFDYSVISDDIWVDHPAGWDETYNWNTMSVEGANDDDVGTFDEDNIPYYQSPLNLIIKYIV